MKSLLSIIALLWCISAFAETIPPKPEHYFNDYAGLTSQATANQLDEQLTALDKQSSTQFVVAVYPTMDSESEVADYTQRIAQSWHVGQKGTNNGVVLFVFVKDNKGKTTTRLEVGYGLEGVLPDATAKNIIDTQIRPHIRAAKAGAGQPEWEAAFRGGIVSVIAAIKNEYHAASVASFGGTDLSLATIVAIIIIALIIIFLIAVFSSGSSGGGGGGYYSSGSSSSGSSSGGGSFGGGGASGSD
jgi:uncharacterized protein